MDEHRLWRRCCEPRSAVGLGMFRIVYSLTLLGEVGQLCYLRHLVFDELPFVSESPWFTLPVFAVWMISIACLAVGFRTRTAAVVNYLMTLATFSTFREWEYHVDYIYAGVNCLLLFVPAGRAVSIDAWLRRRRAGDLHLSPPNTSVARVHYDALILVGIALIYFDSVCYKLASPMWLSGLGLWRPASLPHNTYWNVGWLLDFKLPMLGLSYLTLAFESLFLALMWFDRLRPWLFAVGVGLHLGIVVMFPIPWFGFAVFALYLLLIPDQWWNFIVRPRGPAVAPHSAFVLSPSDLVAARIVFLLAIVVSSWQFLMTSTSDLSLKLTSRFGGEAVRRPIEQLAVRLYRPGRILFGVTRHPVFMDFHFDGYEAFFTLVSVDGEGTRTWLPMAAQTGQGRLGWSGRLWVHWTWRVVNPRPQQAMLRDGFEHVTAWWLGRQQRKLDHETFLVMRRPCDPCRGWSQGYYQRQLAHQWEQVGTATWLNGKFTLDLASGALGPHPESSLSQSTESMVQ